MNAQTCRSPCPEKKCLDGMASQMGVESMTLFPPMMSRLIPHAQLVMQEKNQKNQKILFSLFAFHHPTCRTSETNLHRNAY
jgi:hypothetical protein